MPAPSPSTSDALLKKMKSLADVGQGSLSLAGGVAFKLCIAVKEVQTDHQAYQQLADYAAEVIFVVILMRGVTTIDDELKQGLNAFTDILQQILKHAEFNASLDEDVLYLFAGDAEKLQPLKEAMEQRIKEFGIQSFSELDRKAREQLLQSANRPRRGGNTNNVNYNNTITNQGDHNRTHVGNINQGNGGVINHETNTGPHLFNRARGLNISGGEFNNVGGNINKTEYNARNRANNYGTLNGQNVGDGATINFTGLPR